MLYDAANSLQQCDFTNTENAVHAFQKVEHVIELFDDHADHEDSHILHPMDVHNPSLVAEFENEHITDRRLGAEISSAIAMYRSAANDMDRVRAGEKAFYAFNEFIAFNLVHMNKEETVLNQALWSLYSDAEIGGINGKIAASVAPERSAHSLKWMMRSCNNAEIGQFIGRVKATAPEPLYNMMLGIAEQELPAHRWDIVKEHIGA